MVGQVLGHYRIEALLGAGGTGEVYLAQDLHLARTVAVKVLRPDALVDPEHQRRLRIEARAASALNHPNIVSIYDIDTAHDRVFIAMEHVAGVSLDRFLATHHLSSDEALDYAIQIADGLGAAHAAGIIHRDVKPANIIVTDSGRIKIVDFGLARLPAEPTSESASTTTADVTERLAVLGTFAYMSPEQAVAALVDARSDVFSIGAVLYEMLSGRRFLASTSLLSRLTVNSPMPSAADVPRDIHRILKRCLDSDPHIRHPSARELCQELIACRARREAQRVPVATLLRKPRFTIPAVVLTVLAFIAGAWWWRVQARVRYVRTSVLPQIVQYIGEGRSFDAYRLMRQADAVVPDDPLLDQIRRDSMLPVTIVTEPPGADVYIRGYLDDPDRWQRLGTSPVTERLPFGADIRLRMVKEGFLALERTAWVHPSLHFTLISAATGAPDMERVAGGHAELLDRDIEEFWIDRFEVTNKQFKRFVDGGGYEKPAYWPQSIDEQQRVTSDDIQRFRDVTGRPGPATWELGTYPEGRDDYPVNGVSWFEAVAYCAWAGKSIPTMHHWGLAADFGMTTQLARFSNFAGTGPERVGGDRHLGANGTYDMAGNVKEWVWNSDSAGRHYILGGAWSEAPYMFGDRDARWPLEREAQFGIRCARYLHPLPREALDLVDRPVRDYRTEQPASEPAFDVYRRLYDYDAIPLNAQVESVDDRPEHWRFQRVTVEAPYGKERIPVLLLLPKNSAPPYQAVVMFPGANAYLESKPLVELDAWQTFFYAPLVRSGRAVVLPIYKNMYQRGAPRHLLLPGAWYDSVVFGRKDLSRTIDYLETRPDIDSQRLAYYGLSSGAAMGPIMTALEPRFKASVLLGGGLYPWRRPPEVDPFNFAPRAKVPTLMLNGRDDFFFPIETSQEPLFARLGAGASEKRHRIFESGHMPTERQELIKEILSWLDQHLGPVKSQF